MSATVKLRPRSSPEAEGRPVLRPAGNTARSAPRKASIPPSKPVRDKVRALPVEESSSPPLSGLRVSALTLAEDETPVCLPETVSDCIPSEDGGEKMPSSETQNSGLQKVGTSGAKTKCNAAADVSKNAGKKKLGRCSSPARGTNLDKSTARPPRRTAAAPEVRTNSTQEMLQSLVRSRQRQGSSCPKLGRIVPDGLPAFSVLQESKNRCGWITSQSGLAYVNYHDTEWGVPVHEDRKLFEMLVLVGAQAEVAWPTIIERREIYRRAFAGFDPAAVARFDEKKLHSLKSNSSIMHHEGKLPGIVENASQVLKIVDEFGSFDSYIWGFVNNKTIVGKHRLQRQVPVKTPKAEFMSRDMLKRGFRFVGPTAMYSFMQAVGMVNDHLVTCFRYDACNNPHHLLNCICEPIPEEVSSEEDEIES